MQHSRSTRYRLATGSIICAMLLPLSVQAATYSELVDRGFKTGGLSKNRAGLTGWKVSKGSEAYFCKLKGGLVYVGSNGMASVTSSGRQIKLDKEAYEKFTGGPARLAARFEDLKAGRPQSRNVGPCHPFR